MLMKALSVLGFIARAHLRIGAQHEFGDTFTLVDGDLLGLHKADMNYRQDAESARFVVMKYPGIHRLKQHPPRTALRPYVIWFQGVQLDFCILPPGIPMKRPDAEWSDQHTSFSESGINANDVTLACPFCTSDFPQVGYAYRNSEESGNAKGEMKDECELLSYAKTRDDIIWVNFDLQDAVLSSDDPSYRLHGLVVPPPHFADHDTRLEAHNSHKRKYFLTFRGTNHRGWYDSSTARRDLFRAFKDLGRTDVRVEAVSPDNTSTARFRELLNSTYSLVPHGAGRWNLRLNDVVAACSIPVIVADGLTLPFSPLIDWGSASVVIPESKATAAQAVLDYLPSDSKRVEAMQQRVCEIHDRYFSSPKTRRDAFLQSLVLLADRKSGVDSLTGSDKVGGVSE